MKHFSWQLTCITVALAAMLALTLGLSLVASLCAGLLPAWRAALVTPAVQLKVE